MPRDRDDSPVDNYNGDLCPASSLGPAVRTTWTRRNFGFDPICASKPPPRVRGIRGVGGLTEFGHDSRI